MSEDDPFGLTWDPGPQFAIRDEDTVTLADLLGVPSRSLLLAAGGPWSPGWNRPDELIARFVGRAGMSVGIEVRHIDRLALVGPTRWVRQSPYPDWSLDESVATLNLPQQDAAGEHAFLEQLGRAVDDAARVRPRSRVVCRMCATITPKAYMFGPDMCDGCASSVLGVVF